MPPVENCSYQPGSSSIALSLYEKLLSCLSSIKRINYTGYSIKPDYILKISIYQYECLIKNHFSKYTDTENREYYRYEFSDLDIDLRVKMQIINYKTGRILGIRDSFFSKFASAELYPGDYRYYIDVPYQWWYGTSINVYNGEGLDLNDIHYNPYFNTMDTTVQDLIEDIIYNRRYGILKFLADVFPVKAKIIKLDENPDFVWINAGKSQGVYYKMRFVVFKKGRKVAILRARTIFSNYSRCRVHKIVPDFIPEINLRVKSEGY